MSIEDVFPAMAFSKTEEDIITEIFSNPVVKKYLRIMALEDSKELLELSATSNDKDKLFIAHATVHGKLQVISTLLSIEVISTK